MRGDQASLRLAEEWLAELPPEHLHISLLDVAQTARGQLEAIEKIELTVVQYGVLCALAEKSPMDTDTLCGYLHHSRNRPRVLEICNHLFALGLVGKYVISRRGLESWFISDAGRRYPRLVMEQAPASA
jgi:hypothetical protein